MSSSNTSEEVVLVSRPSGDLRAFRITGALVVGSAALWLFASGNGGVLYWIFLLLASTFVLGWIAVGLRGPSVHTLSLSKHSLTIEGPSQCDKIQLKNIVNLELDEERLGVAIETADNQFFVPSVFPLSVGKLCDLIECRWRASLVSSVQSDEHDTTDSNSNSDTQDKQIGSHR